jgi:hypothetical protein
MVDINNQIIADIRAAPQTFLRLALFANTGHQLNGPNILGNESEVPRYGFTDSVIQGVNSGSLGIFPGSNIHLCGKVMQLASASGDGAKALPLMMRLARAGVINYAGHCDDNNFDVWKVSQEAAKYMRALFDDICAFSKKERREQIGNILRPDSSVEAGRALYGMINRNYK